MGNKSSVKMLPPDIREQIDTLLKQEVTLEAIRAKLGELGADISKSALGRYKQQIDKVGDRLKRSREMSQVFVAQLGAAPEGKQGRIIVEMLQSVIFDHMIPVDEGAEPVYDPHNISMLARAMKDLASAEKISADREIIIRREAMRDAAEAAVATAKSKGLSAETAEEIRASILGIEKRS
jgi:hypothetical protein